MNNNNEKRAKDYITEGLFKLMGKHNYNDITITDITKKAGVNRITFYRNFETKDDVIIKYLEKNDLKFDDGKYKDNGLYQILEYFFNNKEIINLLYKSHAEYLFMEHLISLFDISSESNNILAYTKSAWSYFAFGWANEWYKRGMKETPEEMIKIIDNFQNKND